MSARIRNNNLFCAKCGGTFRLRFPFQIHMLADTIDKFDALHAECEQTWEEPTRESMPNVLKRIDWWIKHGEVGASSKAMYGVFNEERGYGTDHPLDPDDFSRCYELLELIPEWKWRINELIPLSRTWSLMAVNWAELTERYEAKDKGMYEYMKTLGA